MIHKAQLLTMECISAAQKSVLAHVGGPFGNTWPASVHTPKSVEEWIGKSVRSCKKGQFRADFRPPFPSAVTPGLLLNFLAAAIESPGSVLYSSPTL